MDEKIALSWHLTEKEKLTLQQAIRSAANQSELERLKQLFQAPSKNQ
jgi:hypothetical protein